MISWVLFPQASQPSLNFNMSKMAYWVERHKLVFILNSSSNISHRQTFLMKEWVEKTRNFKAASATITWNCPSWVNMEHFDDNSCLKVRPLFCLSNLLSANETPTILWKMWAISKRNCHCLINIGLLSVGFLKAKKTFFMSSLVTPFKPVILENWWVSTATSNKKSNSQSF